MKMKIWTQQGEVEYSEADLEQHHKEMKKSITRAKRKKLLQVEDGKVYFEVVAAYSIPNELQDKKIKKQEP
jgi:formiminotetrahydrofolate cyclodeaminase